ncbi:MAG: transketolase family protein [Bacteroidetes bacterium]|nr:transketolase family protein [Bacteroidota bacterium]
MQLPEINENIMPRVSFGEALVELAEIYPELRVFDADVCSSTQTVNFRNTYPDRFYQMGIAESNMVCAAAGMATLGLTPFVSTFSVFLAKRALDQIRVSVAYPKLNVKLNGAYGGLPTGKAGATHSSVEDIAVMRCMPHMKVLVPGDPLEAKLAVELALKTDGPVYLRTVRCPVPVIFGKNHTLEFGKGAILHEGQDAALISTGMMTPKALAAVEQLAKEGIYVRLIHLASIKPIDEELIIQASRDCGTIVTVENHSVLGGLGSAVTEVVTEHEPCKVHRLGFPDIFMESGDDETIFSRLGMNTENIREKIKSIIKK